MNLMSSTPRSRARFTLIVWAFISIFVGYFSYFYLTESQLGDLPFKFITQSRTLSIIFGIFLLVFAIALMILAVYTWAKNDMGNFKKDNPEEK